MKNKSVVQNEAQALYKCLECGLLYKEEKWAKKCKAWCEKYKSCNLEITKHSLKRTI